MKFTFPKKIKGHKYQQLIWDNDESRFIIAEAGRRGGKTNILGKKCVKNIYRDFTGVGHAPRQQTKSPSVRLQLPRLLYWAVAPTYGLNKAQWKVILGWIPKETIQHIDLSKSQIWLYPEILIQFKSADKPKSLVSEGLNGLWITETARVKQEAWNDNLRPCLSDFNGWLLSDTTPLGENWYVKEIADYADPTRPIYSKEYCFYSWKTVDNTMLPGIKEEVEKARKTMPLKMFQRNYEASREAFEGQIYDEFSSEIHVREFEHVPERYSILLAGQDWGYTHKGVYVIIGIRKDGGIDVIAEIAKSKVPTVKPNEAYTGSSWVDLVKEFNKDYKFNYNGKAFSIEWVFGGPDEPEHIEDYNQNGIPCKKANNAVIPGISLVQILLKPDENNVSRMRIHKRCENLIQNLQTQRWKADTSGNDSQVPEKGSGENDFDSNDALRYAVYSAYKNKYFDVDIPEDLIE